MPLPHLLEMLLKGCVATALLCMVMLGTALAQGVELSTLKANRQDGVLTLDFTAQVSLTRAVEDALQRGVPVYFVAQAEVFRPRWYWRDQSVARVARSWRLVFQPLTSTWRVSLGGLNQSYASLPEALVAISRVSGWKLTELAQLEGDKSAYLEFSYRLDHAQLPSPMQIGLGGPAGWTLGVERSLRLD